MASHEFGIIRHSPTEADEFSTYEPEKYGCISIDDAFIEELMPSFLHIPTYFHRLSWKETGLNYIGITLIPPESCGMLAEVFEKQDNCAYDNVVSLLRTAQREKRFVIHYGL